MCAAQQRSLTQFKCIASVEQQVQVECFEYEVNARNKCRRKRCTVNRRRSRHSCVLPIVLTTHWTPRSFRHLALSLSSSAEIYTATHHRRNTLGWHRTLGALSKSKRSWEITRLADYTMTRRSLFVTDGNSFISESILMNLSQLRRQINCEKVSELLQHYSAKRECLFVTLYGKVCIIV